MFLIFYLLLFFYLFFLIMSFRGALATKNLGTISVDVHEILRFALDDKWFIHRVKHLPEVPLPLCGQG